MSSILKHLHTLSGEIGTRPVGSEGNCRAADYIESVFKAAGLDVQRQNYPCVDWKVTKTHLSVDGKALEANANGYSPSCDTTAPIVVMASLRALKEADIEGKIALLCGELTQEMWTPTGFTIYTPPQQEQIRSLLKAKRPAAIITVSPAFGKTEPLIKDSAFDIPSATVSPTVGLALSLGESIHLEIKTERSDGTACNLVASTGDGPKIILCAHYDSVLGSIGALDNGTGVSVLLSLAESWKESPIALEFIAFDGEELDARGDEVYLQKLGLRLLPVMEGSGHSAILDPVRLVINIDSVGQRLGVDTMALFNLTGERETELKKLAEEKGLSVVEPWPMSNHYTFTSYGVPAIALSSTLIGNLTHGENDRLDWVDPRKLDETVGLVREIIRKTP